MRFKRKVECDISAKLGYFCRYFATRHFSFVLAMLGFSFFSCKPQVKENLPSPPKTDDPVVLLDFVYKDLGSFVKPGISTRDIESRIQGLISETPAVPYFKGYKGYPSIVSTPVNFEVVHTPPTKRRLQDGDILKVEFGLKLNAEHAFVGWTFALGSISPERAKLLTGTHNALAAALREIRSDARVGAISQAVESELTHHGLYPSHEFVGYRIGQQPTMKPAIPCFSSAPVDRTSTIKTGMKLALIVIAHAKEPELRVKSDYWTVHDTQHADSAYFSAMVRVTDAGFEQLNQYPVWIEPAVSGLKLR